MKNIIIGVTSRIEIGKNYNFYRVNSQYIDALNKFNVTLIMLIPGPTLKESLKLCDGVLSTGGDDIDPTYYGQDNSLNLSQDINKLIDETDKEIILYCYQNKIPYLGICRGIQDIAGFLGGTLHQDMAHDNVSHPFIDEHSHMVKKINNFGLATKLPDEFKVNTYHHQVIDKVPEGFKVLFKNDEAIEAIEHDTLPIIGVQWHPERNYTKESEIIFSYYLEKVNEGKNH